MNQQKFAVFDIDGTIFRWQLYHELFDALADEQMIEEQAVTQVLDAREAWRARESEYDTYEKTLIHAMEDAIVGLEEVTFHSIADKIMLTKGHHVYKYTLDLLTKLKAQGYTIIAISGSHQQLVERFSELHGIDIAVGKQYEAKSGKLTNKSNNIFGRKKELLTEIVQENGLSWDDSYAVGDSGSDAGMLELVTHPIAFNPNIELRDAAMKAGWPIVIERKSLSYRLERGIDGTYVLA